MPAVSRLTPDRWLQIEDIFHRATLCDRANRSTFLEQACGTDQELRREVESLLASLEETEPFLESAVQGAAESFLETRSAPPLASGCCLDHYEIIRMLGSGGMGEVYLAQDLRLERKVALKMLPRHLTRDPIALRRLQYEARVLSGLNHANLLTIFEFCSFEGRHFLVTEFVEGETVRQLLDSGPLEQDQAIDIVRQAAAALSVAHASGVIHRDIKPENIIVRTDGCVKLVDFGIAKRTDVLTADTGATPAALTVSGSQLGTPRYMSPEQARGIAVDARTDIFSLGAVLYEMLTGKPAFNGETQSDLIADILRGEPAKLQQAAPGTAKPLQTIVARMLAKDRDERYRSTDELLAGLQQYESKAHLWNRSGNRLLWGMLAVLLIGIAVFAFFVSRRKLPSVASGPRSLAVLPFRNLRPDAATDFLGVSLADEISTKLGYVKAFTVRPSSASNRFREAAGDLHKAARDLKASLLITGTYLKDGSDLRITARLIGFNPDAVLWQNTLDVKYDKLLTVQDQVANSIIQSLALRLGSDEQKRLRSDSAVDPLAYEYYLRGVDLYSASNFSGAIAMLEKSAAIDPNYAPTWAYLGRTYTTEGSLEFGGRKHYRLAEEAYDKAIALNPVFPEPRIYMANLFTDTGRVEGAVPLLRVALQSSPNNAEAHWELGYAYRYAGMLEASLKEAELSRRLDPEVKINSSAMNTYLYLGEVDKFLNSLPANDSPLLIFYHGLGSYYKNMFAEAASDFDRAYELSPDLLPAQVGAALAFAIRHEPQKGVERLHDTEKRIDERGVRDPEAMYKISQAYAVLGDSAEALRMLRRSIEGGFFCYPYIARDPLLNSLRSAPEFGRILEQAKLRNQQFEQRFSR